MAGKEKTVKIQTTKCVAVRWSSIMRDFGRKKRKSRVRHEVALYQPPFKEEIMSSFGQDAHRSMNV